MVFIYSIINLGIFLWGKSFLKKTINPITIYCAVWECAVVLHQSALIDFYDLSFFTWIVIIGGEFLFAMGCFIGAHLKGRSFCIEYNESELKKQLSKYIAITAILSGVAIVGNYLALVAYYGTDLLAQITQIYSDRVHGGTEIETIPYLGSFIYIAVALLGIYLKKYGFSLLLIPVVIFAYMKALISGGRAGLVFIVLIFVFAYWTTMSNRKIEKRSKQKKLKRNIMLFTGAGIMVAMIVVLTIGRSAGIVPTYATERYRMLFGSNPVPYKLVEYVAAPIGALNEYLKDCDFSFGVNTFKTIYNVLEKLGLMERINQYQSFYNTPISCNVATWLRELIQDFSVGALIAVPFFGGVNGYIYRKVKVSSGIRNITVLSILMMVVALSFFDWKIRSADVWIAILFGYIIGRIIDKKSGGLAAKE